MSGTSLEQKIVRFAFLYLMLQGVHLHIALAVIFAAGIAGYSLPLWLVFILSLAATVAKTKTKDVTPDFPPLGKVLGAAFNRHFIIAVIVWPWILAAWWLV